MSSTPKIKSILLVEDDPDDIYLIGEAIDECQLEAKVFIVQDGEELMDFLNHRGEFTEVDNYPFPNLILLDLNMPRKDGREALREIKEDLTLRSIPVVILTTSTSGEDLENMYALGASGFVTKPTSFSGLRETIDKIGSYWLSTVQLRDENKLD
ncbi:MAG: two-component system response regulator [Anaerolineaceae bacterium]|nr:two-component system response regulator [Anaerolineaceae bacterium]